MSDLCHVQMLWHNLCKFDLIFFISFFYKAFLFSAFEIDPKTICDMDLIRLMHSDFNEYQIGKLL